MCADRWWTWTGICWIAAFFCGELWARPTFGSDYDLVIYGGTASGVVAAIQGAEMGQRVVLLEPTNFLGGMTTGGLGATDIGNKRAIGGLAREFYRRIRRHYEQESAWNWERREDFRGGGHAAEDDAAWTFEPHVASEVITAWVAEYPIDVRFEQRLDRQRGIERTGTQLIAIRTLAGERFAGKMFIDATYEGDLMAAAGVRFHVGREANATYGETLNGLQITHAVHHQFVRQVDPFVRRGDPSSGLLPRVTRFPQTDDGTGDHRLQAYNYRLCATDVPPNRLPWPQPAGYDESQYELLLRNFEAGDARVPWNPVRMPNRKTDSNNNFAFSTDNIGMNYAYPEADDTLRTQIVAEHRAYQQGLMWTLANHPRVPQPIRQHFQTWGLARDEFTDNDHWPRQLYVREARRMVGDYVMIEANCRGTRRAERSIGLAAYTMDSHHVQRYVDEAGWVRNEGDVQVGGFPPYPIDYAAIVPAAAECSNLLVPVCLSASHIAYGSIRMEPVFMVTGQSAATAAALAIAGGTSVQEVEYTRLRERLLNDGQRLE